jgi:hypothetical protein
MTIAYVLLYLLILVDAACSAYRDAAGRDCRIDKRAYYRRAVGRGIIAGNVVVALSVMVIVLVGWLTVDKTSLRDDVADGARSACWAAVPYGAVVSSALLMRLVPSVDLRSILSVVLFAPLLFVRPAVTLAAVLYGFWRVPRWEVLLFGLTTAGLLLGVEAAFGYLRRRGLMGEERREGLWSQRSSAL